MKNKPSLLQEHLKSLNLKFIQEQHVAMASQAATEHWDHLEYLRLLVEGQYNQQRHNRIERRTQDARIPVIKTLEQFVWNHPKKINRLAVQHLFRLEFIPQKANVVFMGTVGVGKTHLASALAYAACLADHTALFTSAIGIINDLQEAQKHASLQRALKKYLRPELLVIDEVGYLPIDQKGADLLFQVISQRYERGSIVLTTNKPFKQWSSIFNNDSTIASAVLDRLLHHADTIVIEGPSYRMKDLENPQQ